MIPFSPFLDALRKEGVPVSFNEWLDFLRALACGAIPPDLAGLYAVGRAMLVKNEGYYDRYDRAFLRTFSRLPDEKEDEEIRKLLAGIERETQSAQNLENPEGPGVAPQDNKGGSHKAFHLAGERRFQAYDTDRILDTSGLRRALARWRKTKLKGTIPVLDLERTIGESARNGGEIEIRYSFPFRRRRILLLTDVGGTMNVHVEVVERFLTGLHREIRRIDHFYFHNTLYETLYRDANRREPIPTEEIVLRFSPTHCLVIVGDATMGTHELLYPHSAIEGDNEVPSIAVLGRFQQAFPRAIWLNPEPPERWRFTPSLQIIARFFPMFPLTIPGITSALKTILERDHLPSGGY
jgi:uncharacterized protein with von Willebrand factor type A (vWA) domain